MKTPSRSKDSIFPKPMKRPAAAQDATSYSDENRDKKASGILPGMMSFASAPAIKPKKNPG
jgi:hypothetical protein